MIEKNEVGNKPMSIFEILCNAAGAKTMKREIIFFRVLRIHLSAYLL